MRAHYARRRHWLEQALTEQGFKVVPQQGGIQLVMSVEGDDRELAQKGRRAGLAVQALSDWRLESRGAGGLLMSFTNISSLAMAQQQARMLYQAIK
jgi:transcriptional regulator, GntR family